MPCQVTIYNIDTELATWLKSVANTQYGLFTEYLDNVVFTNTLPP